MLAPAVLAAIWAGGVVWDTVLIALALLAVAEWLSVCGIAINSVWQAAAAASVLCSLVAQHGQPATLLTLTVLPIILPLVAALVSRLPAAGIAYVGLGAAAIQALRGGSGGAGDVFFLMLIIWASDVGAYLAGRLIGGPKLWPAVSPGKTWAGSIGGLFAAMVIAAAVAANFPHDPATILRATLFAAVLAIVGQAGDLMESALKRHFGRKDSGTLIPGHGGLLDRVDGLLAAAPVAMLLRLTTHGVHLWQ